MKPYQLVFLKDEERLIQTISYPTPNQTLMVREIGDPTTLREVEINQLQVVEALCRRCSTRFIPVTWPYPSKENQSRHYFVFGDWVLDCPGCLRGYFWDGRFWNCDRPLDFVPIIKSVARK